MACTACGRNGQSVTLTRGAYTTDPSKSKEVLFKGCTFCIVDLVDAARAGGITIGMPEESLAEYCICSTGYLITNGCPRKRGQLACKK